MFFYLLNLFIYFDYLNKNIDPINCPTNFFINFEKDTLIYKCLFLNLNNFNSKGGAIFINSNLNFDFILNSSNFFECKSSFNGGAISLTLNTGSIYISFVCAYNCYTTSISTLKQFAELNSKDQFNNYFHFVSVFQCAPNHLILRSQSLYFLEGKQNISNFNSSNNQCEVHTSLCIVNPFSFFSIFCNIINNNASNFECIMFNKFSGEMKNSNIVNNNSPLNYGVIYNTVNGIYLMNNCIFLNNKNLLFYVASGSLTIKNSIIFHLNYSIGNSLIHSNQNNLYILSQTLNILNIICNFHYSKKIYYFLNKSLIYFGIFLLI